MHTLKKNYKNILFIRTDRIGDFLLNMPLILNLKKHFPNCKITAVISNNLKELIENLPCIDEFIIFDKKYSSISGKIRLISLLNSKRFDLAIISNPNKTFNWITYFSQIPKRIGYSRKSSFLLTDKIKDRKHEGKKHEIEYNLDLLKLLNINPKVIDPYILVNKKDREIVKEILAKYQLNLSKKLVVIQSQSSNPAKIWLKEYFAKIADMLIDELSVNMIFIGSAQEKEKIDKIINLMKNKAINIAGELKLNELIAFLKRSDILISNDSGPMHIATLVQVPVIAIFGTNLAATSSLRWGPWGKNNIVFDKAALSLITPDEVFDAAKKILKEQKYA